MRLIQHKREALWFYRFLSLVYDRVNTLFWTARMRSQALDVLPLQGPDLDTVDVGAGTGFTTEGLVERIPPARVTMLDQSPHQLGQAARKPALAEVRKIRGDAESLPFLTDSVDRYVSAGSIEYWPDPQAAISEAYRVLREDGWALIVGPLPPANRAARWLAELWMLFPREAEYRRWFENAGFVDLTHRHLAPEWYGGRTPYGIALAGRKPAPGPARLTGERGVERTDSDLSLRGRLVFGFRFVVGSAAGFVFVPIAAVLAARERLRRAR